MADGQNGRTDPTTDTAPQLPPGIPIETDALVVGAGPVGLFQVFQLGLLEIRCHVVDALPHVGGQPVELYPDKPIYDIPGVPVCTGQSLVNALQQQASPMGAAFHLGQTVQAFQRLPDGRMHVRTDRGQRFIAKTLFIAAGVGAFQPRQLKLPGIEVLSGGQLLYSPASASQWAGKRVVVHGGDEQALACAIALASEPEASAASVASSVAASVAVLHRRDAFKADPALLADFRALCAAGRIELLVGQPLALDSEQGRLTAIQVLGADGQTHRVATDLLVALLGLSPQLGPLGGWGLDMARKQLVVNTETFSTSEPGVFAVGDINTYPGKKKLLLSGFHECALAAFGAAAIVFPDRPTLLQYTTTSTRLHQLLGVAAPPKD